MTWFGRFVVAAAAIVAGIVGWMVTSAAVGGGSNATAAGAVDVYSCPTDSGASVIARFAPGDGVWVVGRTGDQWAVVRLPDEPQTPGWVPLAMLDTNATRDQLPEYRCEGTEVAVATTTTVPTGSTTAGTTTTTTIVVSTTSSSTLPPTTVSSDRTPPAVVVTPERPWLYVSTPVAPCSLESTLLVAVSVADPTLPVSVRSLVATWSGPAGPQTAYLTPAGGNRFQLVVTTPGTVAGETPLTITATATDGANNVGIGSTVVSLRDPASFGCTG